MAETSPVNQGVIVEMFRDNGSARIVKDRLIIHSGDKVEERKIETDKAFDETLWEEFGIKV